MDEKNYEDLAIYFPRYVHSMLIKILNMYYHKLMAKIQEKESKTKI